MTSNQYDSIIIDNQTIDHGRKTVVYGPWSIVFRE